MITTTTSSLDTASASDQAAPGFQATDRYGRKLDYLRLSLTDACNLRCIYCMPESMNFRSPGQLLGDAEIMRLVRIFAGIGFRKIRLTGGEPTLRRNLADLVRQISNQPGIREVSMTTNGTRLRELAKPLAQAGLKRINIKLDTLNPARFAEMTRGGRLEDVLSGIEAAEAEGLSVKINVVTVRGYNDGEDAVELARFTIRHDWQIRFLELMPVGRVADFQRRHVVTEKELTRKITDALGPLHVVPCKCVVGGSHVYRLANARGTLGFISSISNPFCGSCNRARITADGRLRLCLLNETGIDLMPHLRNGLSDADLESLILEALQLKPYSHGLADRRAPSDRIMSEIGG